MFPSYLIIALNKITSIVPILEYIVILVVSESSFCKTNFNMAEIKAEEEDYKNYSLPIAYDFKSVDARERILYMNYNRVKADVDQLIVEVRQEFKK